MRCLRLLLPALFVLPAIAQPADTLQRLLEEAFEGAVIDPEGLEALAAWLEELRRQPLNVNTATAEALAQLPGFSLVLAHRLVRYRQQHGPWQNLEELLHIEGFSPELLERLRPFLTVHPPPSPQRLTGYLLQRLDYDPEAHQEAYLGPPYRLQTRLHLSYKALRAGLTLENDPGEPLRWDPERRTYGFDHTVGFLLFEGSGILRRLILGDFSVRWGLGLTLWSLPAIDSYQAAARTPLRQGSGLTPYSGTDETRFFRGLAVMFTLAPSVSLAAFASRRWLDARLDTVATPFLSIVSLPASGLHRTPAEQSRKSQVRADVKGGALLVTKATLSAGLVVYEVLWSSPLEPTPALYQRHAWRGRVAQAAGAFGQIALRQALLGVEIAATAGRPLGLSGHLSGSLGRFAQATLAFRHFPTRFVSLYGDPFDTRSGPPSGETGLYGGLELLLDPAWQLQLAVDHYRHLWPRYGMFWPASGQVRWIQLRYRPRPWLESSLQLRLHQSIRRIEAAGPAGSLLETTLPLHYLALRWQGSYTFSPTVHLKTRLEYVQRTDSTTGRGWLLQHLLRWQPIPPIELDAQLTFFNTTPSLVLYTLEPSLRYSTALSALTSQGQRMLLRLQLRPLRQARLQVRYGITQPLTGTPKRLWQFLAQWQLD